MSLEQCEGTFHLEKRPLNIVICVYQKAAEAAAPGPVNRMLEKVQLHLKEKIEEYRRISVAFISENPGLTVRNFQPLSESAPVCYNEPGDRNHNLAHMWLMGLVLLERQRKAEDEEGAENYLCLITDEKFPREKTQLLFTQSEGILRMHSRFEKLSFCPVLLKSRRAGGELLEEYIRQKKGVVHIFEENGGV